MILVIDRRGTTLRHDNGVLRLQCEGLATRRAPIAQLDMVVVYGNPLAETAVWRALARAAVPTVMLPSRAADGAAVLAGGIATQLPLRRLQHRCADQAAPALTLARWLVRHKLLGYDLPLRVLRDRHGADAKRCAAFLARRDQALSALDASDAIDGLMGQEGAVAHAWFGLLSETLAPAWQFNGRNRRPPRDPVNSLLSLGYTLLGAEVHRGVIAAGLDPSLGFLHQPAAGRESMMLDLTELFRSGVDHFVLGFIDPAGPGNSDFYYREREGCRLSKAMRPRWFGAWAERRQAWPYPLGEPADDQWPDGYLREQVNGWIERLRAEMKQCLPDDEEL